jgi:Tol biopolymer transport system component
MTAMSKRLWETGERHWGARVRCGCGLGLVLGLALGVAAQPVRQPLAVRDPRLPAPVTARGLSGSPVLNADGRFVAFVSRAANLATNRTDGLTLQVYVRDRQAGVTWMASTTADDLAGGDGPSYDPWLSADGRWLVFASEARNLVTNATTGLGDVFVRDLVQGVTRLVSVNATGEAGGNGASAEASLTPDGRFVTFESQASDLVANDTNLQTDVFVRDLQTGTTVLVSQNYPSTGSAGGPVDRLESATTGVVSRDGRYVAYQTAAVDAVPPALQKSSSWDVIVRDLILGTNVLVSLGTNGLAGGGDSESPAMSADGRFIAFRSTAPNLVSSLPASPFSRLFLRDTVTGSTAFIAASSTNQSLLAVSPPVITPDGRFVAYGCDGQVFVWEATTGAAALVSANPSGEPGNGYSESPQFSDDGTKVVFLSWASDLVSVTNNGAAQLYVRDLATGLTTMASTRPDPSGGSGTDCQAGTISSDGNVVAFVSGDGGLVTNDLNHAPDVFVRDLRQSAVEAVSTSLPGTEPKEGDGASFLGPQAVSTDGRFGLFSSLADDLVGNDTNGQLDVFVRDLVAGTNLLVSVSGAGTAAAAGQSQGLGMTPDGRFVLFQSSAPDLIPDVTNTAALRLYVRDLVTGGTRLVPTNSLPPVTVKLYLNGVAVHCTFTISPDGRFVAVGGISLLSTSFYDLVVSDLEQGTNWLVGHGAFYSTVPYSSLTFAGSSPSLFYQAVSTYGGHSNNVYAFDATAITNRLVDLVTNLSWTTTLTRTAVTPDARFLVRQSLNGGTNTVWRDDLDAGTTQILFPGVAIPGVATNYTTAFIPNWRLAVTPDGRWVTFVHRVSVDTNQPPNAGDNVYAVDSSESAVARAGQCERSRRTDDRRAIG